MPYTENIPGLQSMTETRVVDRRDGAIPTAAELAASDTDRLRRRADINRRISEAKLAERRHEEIASTINEINSRKESLACEHVATCAPLQSELGEIERQQIAEIKNRQPADATLEDRRRELLGQLRDANAGLEDAIVREDRLLTALENERIATARMCHTQLLEGELLNTASAEAIAKMIASGNVRDRLERTRDALRNDLRNYPREAGRLVAELQIWEEMLLKAESDASAAYRKCIDEN